VRKLRACRIRIRLEEADRGHDETRHAERTLEALLVDDALLHGVKRPIRGSESLDRDDLLSTHCVREHGARIVRHIIDEHGARAALGAIASELGAGQSEFVAECRGQRFLLQHVDATLLAIDRERDQSLDTAGCRGLLAEHRRGAPEVCGR
jgi:hypothetical protein